MKRKKMTTIKRLAVIALSLVLVGCAAVSSLSAATEPVRADVTVSDVSARLSGSDKADVVEPETAVLNTDEPALSAATEAPYAVAEGSMDVIPDDEVLDVALDEIETTVKSTFTTKGVADLAETGINSATALDTSKTYTLIDGYTIDYSNGWRIKRVSDNQYISGYSGANPIWGSTPVTFSASDGLYFQYSGNNWYLKDDLSIVLMSRAASTFDVTEVTVTPSEPTTQPATQPETQPATQPATEAPTGNTITLYFSNNKSWANVYAYMWNDGTGNIAKAWPGDQLTEGSKNAYGDGIFSVTVDLDQYDRIIFNNGTNGQEDGSKTETIPLSADMNTGIYCGNTITDHAYNVITYPYPLNYTKQIEKLSGEGHGDYDYRLHLTVDGGALESASTETHGGGNDGKGLVVIIDTTETMTSTSDVWNPENKFRAVQHLLQESGGLIDNFLNSGEGNTVTVIGIHGLAGKGTYTQLISEVASGTKLSDFSGDWNDSHTSHNISYVTGFLYVDDYLNNHNDEDTTVVFITGNDPETYVSYSGGEMDPADPRYQWSRGSTASDWRTDYTDKTLNDYKTLMTEHPELTFYSVGVQPVERGDDLLNDMGEYSRGLGRGDYFSANSRDKLEDIFTTIQTIVIPGDKTTNLTVTDTLSEYVKFADPANASATLSTNPQNGVYTTTDTSIVPVINGKTITYQNTGTIDGPFKLEITFDIKLEDNVYRNLDDYPSTGYPATGDPNTDYSTSTSSGQAGYYSNTSATLSYSLNGADAVTKIFPKPVVQAPELVQGQYIFTYQDRYSTEAEPIWRKVTVNVNLKAQEITGYSGNNNQQNVPTFIYTEEAQALYPDGNPLVAAASKVDGNAELTGGDAQKDVSIYKHDIDWGNLANLTAENYTDNRVLLNSEDHTVTVTANTPEKTFTFNYKIMKDNKVVNEAAVKVPYGRAVTFHPQYSDTSKYAYINDTIPSEGFSYWSADEAGTIPITTNLTFGMLLRGDYMKDGNEETVVTVYAQYNANSKLVNDWYPLIEEAQLTHTIDDEFDRVYLDYMTNYLSKDGKVVQELIGESNPNLRYGLIAVKSDAEASGVNLDQENLSKIAKSMISKNKKSAYLDSGHHYTAYIYDYTNDEQISNFNRVLYTLFTDTAKAENCTFTTMAYITVDGTNYFYSPVNTDIHVNDLV